MKRLMSGIMALALLLLLAAPTVAQPPKELKYRGKTVKHWLESLKRDKKADRDTALAGLLALGEKAKAAAVPILVEMLEDRSDEFRAFAAYALGQLGSSAKGAVPALIAALKDDEPKVRGEVIRALGDIGPEAAKAVPALIALFGKDNFQDYYLIWTFGKIGPAASTTLRTLNKAYDNIDATDNSKFSKLDVIKVMGQLGPKAAPILMDIFEKSNDEHIDVFVAVALSEMGPQAAEIVPRLARALPGKGWYCQGEGAFALWRIGQHPLALPTLTRALEEHLGAKLLQPDIPFQRGSPGSTESLCSHLAKIGPAAKDSVPVLMNLLKHNERVLRLQAAWALWTIAKHPQSVPTLEKCLLYQEGNETYADEEVLKMLGVIGPDATAALPALEEALKVMNPQVETSAHSALRRLGVRSNITEAMRKIAPEKYRKAF